MAASRWNGVTAEGQLSAPTVLLQGLTCSVPGRELLGALDLRLLPGGLYLLYGANGAGKSTLLKLLAGLLDRQPGLRLQGTGEVLGQPLQGRSGAQRARLGYMPQQGGLYEALSVADNLGFRAEVLGLARQALPVLLREHGLEALARQRLGLLSGGWRQRVAFAAAVMASPRLLLLDEPTAGVDLEAKAQLWARIQGLCAAGVTVLMSSHDTEEAAQCQHLIALAQGRICYQGTPQDLALSSQGLVNGLRTLLRAGEAQP